VATSSSSGNTSRGIIIALYSHRAASSSCGIIHRTAFSSRGIIIARYSLSRGIIIARYSLLRGIIIARHCYRTALSIARHHPSHGIIIVRYHHQQATSFFLPEPLADLGCKPNERRRPSRQRTRADSVCGNRGSNHTLDVLYGGTRKPRHGRDNAHGH
jgi:hypothetical protein